MHWTLDMTCKEDKSRIRKKQGPLAFNVMKKIAIALFKQASRDKYALNIQSTL
jgi:predicted transposase YbfD/YdcC